MNTGLQASYVLRCGSSFQRIWLVLILLLLFASSAITQLTTGTIAGTVTDQSNAAVPGVTITVKNAATGVTRSTVTGSAGRYEIPDLAVGTYEVSAAMQGFQTSVRSGIELTVGQHAVLDLGLKVGEVSQSVTVAGEVALVETTTATVSNVVNEKQVEDLPLNNRDLNQLAFLEPGVIKSPEGSSVADGLGSKIVVAGARAEQNLYLLDGVPNSDFMASAADATGAYTGAETIKEFQIISNNYSAEYKSAAGAIISAVTKSGTNSIHGSVFEVFRNDKLDASNFFDKAFGNPKPAFKRNQFGGSLGGPIVRDRTFFFVSYEGTRERLNNTATARIPTLAARAGNLAGQTVPVNPAATPYVNLYPVPGQGNTVVQDFHDGTVMIAGTATQPTDADFVTGRFDHQFSSPKAGFLSGTYSYDNSSQTPFGILGDAGNSRGTYDLRHTISAQYTSVLSPTVLNESNFGYSFSDPRGQVWITHRDFSDIAFIPGDKIIGGISVSPLTGIGFSTSPLTVDQKTFLFKDGVSLTRGSHSLRFGMQLNDIRFHHLNYPTGAQGDWVFSSLTDFLAANPNSFTAPFPGSNDPIRNFKQLYFGGYFQDNYQVSRALTLNLGLRYEFVTVPSEQDGKVSTLVRYLDSTVTVGKFMTNPTLRSFSPRFGFAWAPGSHKTSVRGGIGIFYDLPMIANIRSSLATQPPFSQSGTLLSATAPINFPNAYLTQQSLLQSSPALSAFQYNPKDSYAYRWSLNLQRELGADWVISAGYTGARALHLWTGEAPNMNRWQDWPDQPSGPKFWPVITGTNRINPAFGSINLVLANGNSHYQGLALGVQKRLRRGLQIQAGYTFSKTIDQGNAISGGASVDNQRTINAWDMNLKTALSSQDVRNRLTTNFSYEVPLGQNFTGIKGVLAKEWQLNGIVTLSSGSPATVRDSATTAQTNRLAETGGLTVDLVPGGKTNPTSGTTSGCTDLSGQVPAGASLGGPNLYFDPCQFAPSTLGFFGTLGRNTVILPGLETLDFSVMKHFNVTEKSRIEFRGELFNLLNRANFGAPVMTPFTSKGVRNAQAGQITTTATKAREIQFGLRYIF